MMSQRFSRWWSYSILSYFMWSLLSCYSASPSNISLTLHNQLLMAKILWKLLHHAEFHWNRKIGWVMANEHSSIWQPSAILNLKNIHICDKVQNLHFVPNFIYAYIAVVWCPSIRLSVTFVDHVKMNKNIFKIFSPSCSHTTLVFP